MSCNSCNDNTNTSSLYYVDCASTPSTLGCINVIDAQCIVYNGDKLDCLDVETGASRLEAILQLIDARLCSVTPSSDYSGYNMHCLVTEADESPANQQQFVESITRTLCSLITSYDTFTSSTYISGMQGVVDNIFALNNPGLTCSVASVGPSDTLPQILTKYCTLLGTLSARLDLTGVNWSQCFSVTTPTTIAQGFDALIDMICSVQTDTAAFVSDTYKVKVSSTDPTPNWLANKFTSNCMTFSEYTALSGEHKIDVTLDIPRYTFDSGQFDVTTISTNACGNTQLVTIKPSLLTSPTTIDCSTIDSYYNNIIAGTVPNYVLGSASNLCQKIDPCGIRGMIADGLASGDYILRVNTAAGSCTGKFAFVAAPSVLSCTTLNALFSAEVVGEAPSVMYGNDGANCQKYEACGIRNWIFSGYSTGTYSIAVDTTETGCNIVTLIPASVGFTPELPCWSNAWVNATPSASGNNGAGSTYATTNTGVAAFGGGPLEHVLGTKYTKLGDLQMRGTLQIDLVIIGSDGECRKGHFDIPLGVTLSPSCFKDITKGAVVDANMGMVTDCSEMLETYIIPRVVLDLPGNTMYLRLEYSTDGPGTISCVVSFDNIQFNLG